MKVILNFLLALCFVCTTGCIKLSGDGGSSSGGSDSSNAGKVLSLNPVKTIDLSGFLKNHPDATSIYIGVEGVTGVQLSAEEARLAGSISLGARGAAPHYDVIISTPSGDVRTITY